MYKYQFKDVTLRQNHSLTPHSSNINQAIYTTFGLNVLNISVHNNFFEFTLRNNATNSEKRMLGKNIVNLDPFLNNLKKNYGYSTQLFIAF